MFDLLSYVLSKKYTEKMIENVSGGTSGVIRPDGESIIIDDTGTISAKKATENTFGIVSGGSNGVTVDSDGVMGVDTTFTQATELANIIAAEAFSIVLGKVSKAIATTMSLDENALLKSMLSSVDVNDPTKIPTSAYIHKLVERIGMGTDLDSGDSLTAAVNELNSDLATTQSTTITTNYGISLNFYKKGNIVSVKISGTFANFTTSINIVVATVAEDYRPAHDIGWGTYTHQASTYAPFLFRVRPSGDVEVNILSALLTGYVNVIYTYAH